MVVMFKKRMPKAYIPTEHPHPVRKAQPRKSYGEWPDEMVEELKRLHAAGISFRDMTTELQAKFPTYPKTRNAVIGKATRIGLVESCPRRASIKPRVPKPRKPRPKRMHPVKESGLENARLRREDEPGASTGYRMRRARSAEELAKAKLGSLPDIVDSAPTSSLLVADASEDRCMWPASESPRDMRVCGGKATIGAYCDVHAIRAYRVMPTRKRNAAYQAPQLEWRGKQGEVCE